MKNIAGQIPSQLGDREKVKWICDYLTKNVKVHNFLEWLDATDDGEDTSSPLYEKGMLSDTGYGALQKKYASEKGYMEAFGAIARETGLEFT